MIWLRSDAHRTTPRFQRCASEVPIESHYIPLYPLAPDEVEWCKHVVREELRKFPQKIIKRYLSRIYLLRDLMYQDVDVGGVNFRSTRTICLNAGPGATESRYIAEVS